MQRITWSGIALHAGVVPGYPASHGCIRLPNQFAVDLWGMTRIGARVVVAPDDASVYDIEHPLLPAPCCLPQLGQPRAPRNRRAQGRVGVAINGPSFLGLAQAEAQVTGRRRPPSS